MNFRNFKPETIKFSGLTANPKQPGFSSCKPESPCLIQLPNLQFPFGVSEPNVEKRILKYSLPISLSGEDPTGIKAELKKKFEDFENWLAGYASEHSEMFFDSKKKKSAEVCKELMNSTLKVDKNKEKAAKYGARLSPTVQHSEESGFYNVEVYDTDGKEMAPSDIKRQCKGYATIELTSLYSVGGKAFGATWVVRVIRITQHAASQAPPIALDMYGDCPPELEAALLALPIPGEHAIADYEHAAVGDKIQRAEEEEEGAKSTKKAKKSTAADDESFPSSSKKAKK